MKLALILAIAISLAGCDTMKNALTPQIVVKTVPVPTPVRCAPNIGAEPDYKDTDAALKAAPDLFTQVQLLLAGRIQRINRDAVKSAALAGCAG